MQFELGTKGEAPEASFQFQAAAQLFERELTIEMEIGQGPACLVITALLVLLVIMA